MPSLKVEHAWVEFSVPKTSSPKKHRSLTGGRLDKHRGIVTALEDISFELKSGDRLGLMGHNGAGKSTMLRLLAGAYAPTRGRVVSSGRISTLLNATPGLNIDGTGRENIVTCGLHLGMSYRHINSKMEEIADFAELGDFIDLPVRIYSAGMVTRLGFSIATAVDTEILLLDEGLATGDAHFAKKAQQRMAELMKSAAILVIASHSQALLADTCTRCLLMEHGRIVGDGHPKTVLHDYQNSVVARARQDDEDGLLHSYQLATDMVQKGQTPSLALEEQALRYALQIAPDDIPMITRYFRVVENQSRRLEPEIEADLVLRVLSKEPERKDMKKRLSSLMETCGAELNSELRTKVTDVMNAN
ncbi:MAG: ABC transporter ATP-binding protein [Pseudomonadota bacterium]